ncbi:MAG: hypothetical protein NZ739_06120 [Verrucomicrobiae bacterium]|nr:hypothetical protein [Verrucomicrobiae bacterium]MDW7980777.1 hypothetical protein [Verrucomicrobiales bacterium]
MNPHPAVKPWSAACPGAACELELAARRGFKDFVFKSDFMTVSPCGRADCLRIAGL